LVGAGSGEGLVCQFLPRPAKIGRRGGVNIPIHKSTVDLCVGIWFEAKVFISKSVTLGRVLTADVV